MSDGDAILSSGSAASGTNNWSKSPHSRVERYLLIDAAVATSIGAGKWIDITGCHRAVAHVLSTGVTTGHTVQFRTIDTVDGSAPANSADGAQIGSDVAVSATGDIDFAPLAGGNTVRWIKAIVSAWTDGTVNVPLAVEYRL